MLARSVPYPLLLAVCMGCLPPGTVVGPIGSDDLRTAFYAVGVRDSAPELSLLLSNGLFECGLPNFDDPAEKEQALHAIFAAACREGAQHVALHLYQHDAEGWKGRSPGRTGASIADVTADVPRVGRGAYYGVEEAFLIELDGLHRGYAAAESVLLPDLGDGGEIVIDDDDGEHLTGRFSFPDEQVSGEFRAARCAGDTSLLSLLAALPTHLCQ